MKTSNFLLILAAAVLSVSATSARAADVLIGVPNWRSEAATANILKVVLEDNLGLEVELQNGTNPVIFEAMDSGSIKIHPEVRLPNQADPHDKFVNENGAVRMNRNCVPSFRACACPGQQLTGPASPRFLISRIPTWRRTSTTAATGLGEVWIGASGWESTNIEEIRAKSYGYDETMKLVEMDDTLAMANVDSAIAKDDDNVFYYYTPN